jgi:hypothetical protein
MDIQLTLPLPQQTKDSGKPEAAQLALRAGDVLTASVLDVEKGRDALLAFGGFKAYARLPLPVVAGQEVQIRVDEKGGRLGMVMVSGSGPQTNEPRGDHMEVRLFEPVSDKPFLSAHFRSLVPGESIEGRITGFEKEGLMLVDFGKFKAFAKIDIPVRQGQTLSLIAVKQEQGVAFEVASAHRSSGSAHIPPANDNAIFSGARSDAARQASSVDQPVRQAAAAVPSPSAGSAAHGAGPSAPASGTDMVVLREQVQALLHGPNQEKAGSMPLPTAMKTALANLQQALDPASAGGDTTTLMDRVRDFVEHSGLYFEKHLEAAINRLQAGPTPMTPADLAGQPAIRDLMVKDLKPNLLILKQFLDMQPLDLPGIDRHMLETLKSVAQRAIAHIEQQQVMATEKPPDPDLFQAFSHLMLLTDTSRHARLKVYYAKKGRDDAHKQPRVSLLLDMDRMGPVRSDLWMVGRDLNVTFFVQNPEIKAALETERHRIVESLKESFNTIAVSVVVNEKKIAQFEGEELIAPSRRQVDLSI